MIIVISYRYQILCSAVSAVYCSRLTTELHLIIFVCFKGYQETSIDKVCTSNLSESASSQIQGNYFDDGVTKIGKLHQTNL